MPKGPQPPRLIFEISSLSRWHGTPVGISRVERSLASWARTHRPDVTFAFFDPLGQEFRAIRPEWIDPVLAGSAVVDSWNVPDPDPTRPRKSKLIPESIRPAVMNLLQPKRWALSRLEGIRLTTASAWVVSFVEHLQAVLLSEKYRRQLTTSAGHRRAMVPHALFTGDKLELTPRDIVFSAGSGWSHLNIGAIREHKRRDGFKFALLCYDLIPLMNPEWYLPRDVVAIRRYFEIAFPLSDLVLFTARRIESDARAYCVTNRLSIKATRVAPLGADAAVVGAKQQFAPYGLGRNRYALFVSTIEPRKGHRMLYEVWKRLLAEGIPQATGFKLVFVGRPGWMVEDLLRDLADDRDLGDSLRVVSYAEDDVLAALYSNAAFCLFPSSYEGYGLPIVEAFLHGKAVIASTGGAIPEVVGEFSPCLDVNDTEAWYRLIRQWIENPSLHVAYENAIRTRYRPLTWDQAAARLFAAIDEALG